MLARQCVLWSGGKDSFLAYLLSRRNADDSFVFVTFVPRFGFFHCHPLPILIEHGKYFEVPHEFIVIDEHDWVDSYRKAFASLKMRYNIDRIISGDIFSCSTHGTFWLAGVPAFHLSLPEWLASLQSLGLEFEAPLSTLYAEEIINLLCRYRIHAVITGLSCEWFSEGLLGKPLSMALLKSSSLYSDPRFDLCGERGEYHTTVIRFENKIFCDSDLDKLEPKLVNGIWALSWDMGWLNQAITRRYVS